MTTVVHCQREDFDVYIGRPSLWANPYSHVASAHAPFHVETRAEAVEKYEVWLRQQDVLLDKLIELKGRTLGCWCNPGELCHGQIIIKLIEEIHGP